MDSKRRSESDKLNSLLAKTLGIQLSDITDDMSPDTVDDWDSLKHINLMIAIEEGFNISLTPEEVESMLSIGLIKQVLNEHGIKVI